MHNDVSSSVKLSTFGLGEPVCAVRYLRMMQGGSRAGLVEGSDGLHYIVKTAGNPLAPNVLANEFLGSALAKAVRLPVARPRAVLLTPEFVRSAPLRQTLNGQTYCPEAGLHYGSQMVSLLTPHRTMEYIPSCRAPFVWNSKAYLGMYLFDVWAKHHDVRQQIFTQDRSSGKLEVTFIDHGNLFGGSTWDFESPEPISQTKSPRRYMHLWTRRSMLGWIRLFQTKLPKAIDVAINRLPPWWFTGDIKELQAQLHHRLLNLPSLIENAIARDQHLQERLDGKLHIQGFGICGVQSHG